jgi:hypothetical protein
MSDFRGFTIRGAWNLLVLRIGYDCWVTSQSLLSSGNSPGLEQRQDSGHPNEHPHPWNAFPITLSWVIGKQSSHFFLPPSKGQDLPIITAPGWWKQAGLEFKASLGFTWDPVSKKKKNTDWQVSINSSLVLPTGSDTTINLKQCALIQTHPGLNYGFNT